MDPDRRLAVGNGWTRLAPGLMTAGDARSSVSTGSNPTGITAHVAETRIGVPAQ